MIPAQIVVFPHGFKSTPHSQLEKIKVPLVWHCSPQRSWCQSHVSCIGSISRGGAAKTTALAFHSDYCPSNYWSTEMAEWLARLPQVSETSLSSCGGMYRTSRRIFHQAISLVHQGIGAKRRARMPFLPLILHGVSELRSWGWFYFLSQGWVHVNIAISEAYVFLSI